MLKKKKVNARLLEQFKEFKALRKILVGVLDAELSTDKILEEDDWKVLLKNSKISARAKAAITKVLEANKDYSNPKEFVQMVERFYVHRYNNQEKFDQQTNIENYREQLEHSIEYTLKQKGITVKGTDLSANLILLLRGRIKEADSNKGTVLSKVIENAQFNSSQINLSLDSKDIKLPKVTQILNSLPRIKKWQFGIDETVLNFSATAIGAYKENKALQINIAKIGDNFSAAMDVFTTDINASLTKLDFGAAVAAGGGKVSFDLGALGTFELGVNVADFSASIKEGVGFTPIKFSGKLEFSTEKHKKWFEQYEELMKLVTFKIEFVVSITTSIGLKPSISLDKKVEDSVKKILKEQEQIVNTKQTEYLKKQEAYNDLIEKKQKISKLQKENKSLEKLIRKEKNPAKKKKLMVQKGLRRIEVIKEHQMITKVLEQEGVGTLGNLKDQVIQKSKDVDAVIKKTIEKYDKVVDKITKPAYKLMAELLQKQAGKRLVSLLMKAVPGLNVISLAFDIYDAYTLVRDISAAYMDADTEMEIDAELATQMANASVDLNEVPEVIITFFTFIGAGGHLIELNIEEVEELEEFFIEHFPEGDNSIDFTQFMFSYDAYYDTETISNNEELIMSLVKYKASYNKDLIIQEGEVIELDNEEFEDAEATNFFKKATYKIKGGTPLDLGAIVKVDASGLDKNSKGEERQIIVPNDNLILLEVTKILDKETTELKNKEDFILKVEGFKTYRLQKGATFVYNVNNQTIIRK
jgi:hypothetical protein